MVDGDNQTPEQMQAQKASTDAANDSLRAFNGTANDAVNKFKLMSDFMGKSQAVLNGLIGNFKVFTDMQKTGAMLTQQQTQLFGVMTSSVLGATKAFDDFGHIEGINLFSTQIDDMVGAASRAAKPMESLSGIVNSFGLHIVSKAGEGVKEFAHRVSEAAKAMMAGPDAALRLQTGYLQMAGASGQFGDIVMKAGPHLQNLNNLLQVQSKVIGEAAMATNTEIKSVVSYYNALGKIPGYLGANVDATDNNGRHLNMLTAAMKIATGTGQNMDDVLKDLSTAYDTYGASGEKALEFTARIADLSQKYNIRIEDTRQFMDNMAGSFKFFGDNVEGAAQTFDRFFQGLRDSGLGAKASMEIVNDFGKSIFNLTTAQKAFLSARTGGPGGLMGSLQIEQDIASGRMGDVTKRLEAALKQQFGRIVTREEGATSPQAAQQFIRQRMFLTQGPFGQMFGGGAEGEQKATKFLEAMSKQGSKGVDIQKVLSQDIQRGTDIQNKSRTELSQANIRLEAIKMHTGILALGTAQRMFTPATSDQDLRRKLEGSIVDSMKSGLEATRQAAKTQQDDKSALYLSESFQSMMDVLDGFGDSAKSAGGELKELFDTQKGMSSDREEEYQRMRRSTSVGVAADVAARTTQQREQAHTQRPEERRAPPRPENITVQVVGVCPDCHKKFAKDPQRAAINNSPEIGPGF